MDTVEIAVQVMKETARAVLVDDGKGEHWIPKSVIDEHPDEWMEASSLQVAEWFAEKEGLI